ncbi:hypothetical protein EHQ12_06450 [Leptospira gomenensis]|uniref:DUF996 domain-containing protein n=1 Tax=Leptospira gomenensis TaxID=2484974 RepID=A0A5F1YHL9_9LEPT|nr:hypothetical protein [Leptospira gomenensis]TGK28821.1 hypothetical protein EHQ17_17320 [Leptospira gomenensis]TGK40973.1 hypothetical protein EHQ12_06450 [Leptospira gomenensis]TGK46175.1 hypothetical protein EHQ07_06950 [Leptospira gomenensis]TGK54700.1 hypothetical protein EHQ13_18540 [Leptospira gomenensis]
MFERNRLERIGNVSGIVAGIASGILIPILFVPGLKDIEWLTQSVVTVSGFLILFFGGLFLFTSLGLNVMRSGELNQMILFISFPIPKPIARLLGFGFFLLGCLALLCSLLYFLAYAIRWIR